jgi:predicted CoA-substrate-specific enzyme activase
MNMERILGIDIGSATSSVVVIDPSGKVHFSSYLFHAGQVEQTLKQQLAGIVDAVGGIACTSSCPDVLRDAQRFDNRVAAITAAKQYHPGMEGLLLIGAEKFGLATFDPDGNYLNYRSNSSCAAGTGSFLDQQLSRLNLDSIARLGELSVSNKGEFPKIASRCSVFAKTDLIHAQQEGYSLAQICDGLCYGLAKNVIDTVFEDEVSGMLVMAGGVSLNAGVVKHVERILKNAPVIGEHPQLFGAIGAALMFAAGHELTPGRYLDIGEVIQHRERTKRFHNPPLVLKRSAYPDFTALEDHLFRSSKHAEMAAVEVSVYEQLPAGGTTRVLLGIDIGSTSTKAVVTDMEKRVLAGLYTRTSGRPVSAVQCLFEAIEDISARHNHSFTFAGAGTTGSGRKLIGRIIGADAVPDEITAHARAARELDPEVDTIIEIGGQDSKFTLMKDGIVTFSIMNNVCAAGTGSFIEEQAHKLNTPLSEYAERAARASSPMTSDRCTVFMERDLNHYLNEGYDTDELLASVLHSIRDNYLAKVTGKAKIGDRIFFQGATAKNRALVAAFEQKLGKPIMVSKFCHLTGALGVALQIRDQGAETTSFRGTRLWKHDIPVRTEVCELCNNNCKLRIAEVEGETVAYGFLCGRDYGTEKYVKKETGAFELTDEYRKHFTYAQESKSSTITIGLPPVLHMADEMLMWQRFFDLLGIRTLTSDRYTTSVKDGKKLADAEFCAPVASAFGHVHFLAEKADYVFLPVYLEEGKSISNSKQYCYYTQFISSMLASTRGFRDRQKLLMPLVKSLKPEGKAVTALTHMLHTIGYGDLGSREVGTAYREAKEYLALRLEDWRRVYLEHTDPFRPEVVILGRPYTVLSPAMNNNIPTIFASQGYNAWFMNMLPAAEPESEAHEALEKAMTWKYASMIIRIAGHVAASEHLYPVLVTSFKCTPDSFAIEYFREIMEAYDKPYLVLQLDEHDSAVGYETRIEAAIQSFRNHYYWRKKVSSHEARLPRYEEDGDGEAVTDLPGEVSEILEDHQLDPSGLDLTGEEAITDFDLSALKTGQTSLVKDRTILMPGWDLHASKLLEALLKSEGIDAVMLPDTPDTIQRSLNTNTGQCLPLNIVVQNAYEYITEKKLDPRSVTIWVPKGYVACNLTMFPHYMRKLLRRFDERLSEVTIYPGNLAFYDFSVKMGVNAYLVFLFSGSIRKVACRIRPYEKEKGATDRVVGKAMDMLYRAFLEQSPKEPVIKEIMTLFDKVRVHPGNRPKVAIFGDLYVRDNDVFNQNLVGVIEENGGEALITSLSEYLKIILKQTEIRLFEEGRYLEHYNLRLLKNLIPMLEKKYNKYFSKYIKDIRPFNGELNEILDRYHLEMLHRGESLDNILKIENLVRNYDDISLFVQTNPAYCCPSLVTEAMASNIERLTGIPVLSIEYDGTKGAKNEGVIPYLKLRV